MLDVVPGGLEDPGVVFDVRILEGLWLPYQAECLLQLQSQYPLVVEAQLHTRRNPSHLLD